MSGLTQTILQREILFVKRDMPQDPLVRGELLGNIPHSEDHRVLSEKDLSKGYLERTYEEIYKMDPMRVPRE